jgi:hypothetical protein
MQSFYKNTFIQSFIILLLCTAIIILLPPNKANFLSISDSLEYIAATKNLINSQTYELKINSKFYPSRYLPWYGITNIYPWLYFFPNREELLIISSWLSGILGIFIGYLIARKISGSLIGGIITVIFISMNGSYRYFSQTLMPDIFITTLHLCCLYIWLSIFSDEKSTKKIYLILSAIAIALAFSIKPTSLSLIIPWILLFIRQKNYKAFSYFFIPTENIVILSVLFNYYYFQSFIRCGYNYWASVPYDYLTLVFSPNYLETNLARAGNSLAAIFFLIFTIFYYHRKSPENLRNRLFNTPELRWIVLTTLPILSFYLFYFYTTERFYLPVLIPTLAVLGGWLGKLIPIEKESLFLSSGLLILGFFCSYQISQKENYLSTAFNFSPTKYWRDIKMKIPETGVVVSGSHPLFFEIFSRRNKNQLLIPTNRDVEFASKVITKHKITELSPPPKDAFDHRTKGLLKKISSGSVAEVFPYTAVSKNSSSNLTNKTVFILKSTVSKKETKLLIKKFPNAKLLD